MNTLEMILNENCQVIGRQVEMPVPYIGHRIVVSDHLFIELSSKLIPKNKSVRNPNSLLNRIMELPMDESICSACSEYSCELHSDLSDFMNSSNFIIESLQLIAAV